MHNIGVYIYIYDTVLYANLLVKPAFPLPGNSFDINQEASPLSFCALVTKLGHADLTCF